MQTINTIFRCRFRDAALLAAFFTVAFGTVLHAQTTGDPDSTDIVGQDSLEIIVPGSGSGTEGGYVDSVYYNGRMIRLTVRISQEMRRDSVRLRAFIDSIENAQDAIVARNLAFSPEEWRVTSADKARKAEELAIAQDRDYIYPSDVAPIPVFSAPVGAIARSLGLVEDVTPRIAYTIKSTTTIRITIYTQSALPVTTMVDDVQRPGEYVFTWDFTDANGRRVLTGTYFAEVIANDKTLILRKRIEAP